MITLLTKLGTSLVLLMFLTRLFDGSEAKNILSSLHLYPILFAGILYVMSQGVSATRWQVLLRSRGVAVPWRTLFSIYLVGMFFNNFLPTSLGGDLVRGVDLYRVTGKLDVTISSIFLDRVLGVVALLILGDLAWGLGIATGTVLDAGLMAVVCLTGFTGVLLALSFFILNSKGVLIVTKLLRRVRVFRFGRKLAGYFRSVRAYRRQPRVLGQAIFLSLCVQLLNIAVYYVLMTMLGVTLTWWHLFLFFPVVTLMSMLPISFNGLGVREGSWVLLLSLVGISATPAMMLSLTWYFLVACLSSIGAVIYVFRRRRSAEA